MFPLMVPMFPMVPNLYKLQNDYPEPPTIYALLNSYVNYGKPEEEKKPIKDLAKYGRSMFFYTDYPLSTHVSREDFEVMILNHFLMRRIGFDTVHAFSIRLINKLCEIMPEYNKMFDALNGWSLFTDGETVTKTSTTQTADSNTGTASSDKTTSSSTNTTADNRYSDTPQNNLTDVKNGSYVSEYTYNTGQATDQGSEHTSSSNHDSSEGNSTTNETITRSPSDKIRIYEEFTKNKSHIYSMIFEELESLFYQNVLI